MSGALPDGITHEAINVVTDYAMARKGALNRRYDGFSTGWREVTIGTPRDFPRTTIGVIVLVVLDMEILFYLHECNSL